MDDTKQSSAGQSSSAFPRLQHVQKPTGSSTECSYVSNSREPGVFLVAPFTDGMRVASSGLRKYESAIPPSPPPFTQTVGVGLQTALDSFSKCVHNLADVIQIAANTSPLATETTMTVDPHLFTQAAQGLQAAATAIAALGQSLLEDSSENKANNIAQSGLQSISSPANDENQPCSVVLWPVSDVNNLTAMCLLDKMLNRPDA